MDKLLFGKMLLALLFVFPTPAMAGVNVDVNISLPPPIFFAAPPALIVLPETYVYVVPDTDVEIFFYDGWWWRPWEGRWYRSHNYGSGWRHYRSVPSFYVQVPSGWRNDYRDRRWRGHEWDHRPIPHEQVKRNWNGWKKDKHWEKQNTWGVRDLKPQTRSQHPVGAVQPKHQTVKPQVREVKRQEPGQQSQPKTELRQKDKPQLPREQSHDVQRQQPRPQSREVREKHAPSQQREKQQQTKPQQGKPEKEHKEKQDRKQDNK